MKKIITIAFAAFLLGFVHQASAQSFLDRMKQKAKDKVNQRVDADAGKAMDKGLDKVDPTNTQNKGNNNNKASNSNNSSTGEAATTAGKAAPQPTIAAYKNYDFVPGDQIIFESGLADEQTGEIPSRFILNRGQADVQTEDGENVIHIPKGANASIAPRLANGAGLPDTYTIEFDFKDEQYGVNHINVDFGYRVGSYVDEKYAQGIGFADHLVNWKHGDVAYPDALIAATKQPMAWHHYAISINKDAGKAYIDQYRVVNLNDLTGDHSHINIEAIAYENSYIKNIRISTGGMNLYKKVTTDNKIVAHGILFDVNQSTLKPESMGTINGIYALLQKDPSLKFEIGGHTDNTGDAARNMALSKQRADAVKAQLVTMGVDETRLTTKGYGDTKPLGTNDTPEGKANNRRVEFIKI